jgi:hypothetical protein
MFKERWSAEEGRMSVAIEQITETEAKSRRASILANIADEKDFRQRAAEYRLTLAERALFNELEDLEYLLSL